MLRLLTTQSFTRTFCSNEHSVAQSIHLFLRCQLRATVRTDENPIQICFLLTQRKPIAFFDLKYRGWCLSGNCTSKPNFWVRPSQTFPRGSSTILREILNNVFPKSVVFSGGNTTRACMNQYLPTQKKLVHFLLKSYYQVIFSRLWYS